MTASHTPRFGFNFFGGGVQGTPNDEGQKFFGLDRLTLDRLLSQAEAHDHHLHPDASLTLTEATTSVASAGGTLPAGWSYYYRYSVVDAQGVETLASPEAIAAIPAALPVPGLPQLAADATAGALSPGMYYYAVTAIRGTEETPLGLAALLALQPGETSVRVTLPEYGDADSLRVWRMGAGEPGYTRIGMADSPDATFLDTGSVPADPCACDPGVAPPSSNIGANTYSVTVILPDDVDLSAARSWRLYRTTSSGIYTANSLVHEVVERESEWDPTSPLQTSWIDAGGALAAGKPMDTDQNMRTQPYVYEVLAADPDPAGYPEGYPIISGGAHKVLVGGAWEQVGGASLSYETIWEYKGPVNYLTYGVTQFPSPTLPPEVTTDECSIEFGEFAATELPAGPSGTSPATMPTDGADGDLLVLLTIGHDAPPTIAGWTPVPDFLSNGGAYVRPWASDASADVPLAPTAAPVFVFTVRRSEGAWDLGSVDSPYLVDASLGGTFARGDIVVLLGGPDPIEFLDAAGDHDLMVPMAPGTVGSFAAGPDNLVFTAFALQAEVTLDPSITPAGHLFVIPGGALTRTISWTPPHFGASRVSSYRLRTLYTDGTITVQEFAEPQTGVVLGNDVRAVDVLARSAGGDSVTVEIPGEAI